MNKKDMSFLQAFNKYNLPLFSDVDKDKIPNVFDCKPFDPNRDGLFGRAVNVLTMGKYGQSKEEYETGKTSNIHFERDPASGKIVNVTRDGQEISPWKSAKQLEREHRQNQAEEVFKIKLQQQKIKNEQIKQQIELQKLRDKEQKLRQKQRLQAALNPQLSMAQNAVSLIFGVNPQRPLLQRSGYYIEQVPKLPKGYKWKKIPKSKKSQSTNQPNYCPYCKVPLILAPDMLGRLRLICPICGGIY